MWESAGQLYWKWILEIPQALYRPFSHNVICNTGIHSTVSSKEMSNQLSVLILGGYRRQRDIYNALDGLQSYKV